MTEETEVVEEPQQIVDESQQPTQEVAEAPKRDPGHNWRDG